MAEPLELVFKADDQLSGTVSGLKGSLSGLGDIAKNVLSAGVVVAGVGLGALTGEIVASTQAAMAHQDVLAGTKAVLESTGGVAGVSQAQVEGFANSLAEATKFSNEQILSGENLLLTFTNIKEDAFGGVTELALDMSQALGQDLKSSVLQLGKAFNDPVVGASALREVGVSLSAAQIQQVKDFMAVNDLAGAQGVLMKELKNEFGGAAKAAGETMSGQLTILQNKFGDVQEEVGSAFIPILTELLTTMEPYIQKYLPLFAQFMEEDIAPALGTVVEALGGFLDGLEEGQTPAQLFTNILSTLFGPEAGEGAATFFTQFQEGLDNLNKLLADTGITTGVQAIADAVTKNMPAAKAVWDDVMSSFGKQGDVLGPDFMKTMTEVLKVTGAVLKGIADFWSEYGDDIMAVVGFVFKYIGTIISVSLQYSWGLIRTILQLIQGDWQGAWQTVQDTVDGILKTVLDLFGVSFDDLKKKAADIGKLLPDAFEMAKTQVTSKIREFQVIGSSIIQGIVDGIRTGGSILVDTITQMVNDTINAILSTLNISSPSGVMKDIFMNVPLGAAEGIKAESSAPIDAMLEMTKRMTEAADRFGGVGSGGENMNMHNYGPQTYVFEGLKNPKQMLRDLRALGGAG